METNKRSPLPHHPTIGMPLNLLLPTLINGSYPSTYSVASPSRKLLASLCYKESHIEEDQALSAGLVSTSVNSSNYGPLPPDSPKWCLAPFDPEGILRLVGVAGIPFSKPLYMCCMCITAGASGLFLTIIFYVFPSLLILAFISIIYLRVSGKLQAK